jgi:hypothetical protein
MAIFFIPQFRIFNFFPVLSSLPVFFWFLLSFLSNPDYYFIKSKFALLSLLFVIYTFFVPYLLGIEVIGNRYLSFLSVFYFYWVYEYNSLFRGRDANKKIVYYSIPILLYPSINTLIGLMKSPNLSRSIKGSGLETEILRKEGFGGYELIYATVILLIIVLPFVLDKNRMISKGKKLLLMLYTILALGLIIYSNYFTAFLVSFFAILVYWILLRFKKFVIFLMPIIFFYLIFSSTINLYIVKNIIPITPEDGLTHTRLVEIKNEIEFGYETESVDSRSSVNRQSIEIFSEYPILGYICGIDNSNDFDLSIIGQHSHIMDTFAFFGLFIGIFMLYIMFLPFYIRIIKQEHGLKVFALTVCLVFFILIAANNLTPTMGYAAFFVFPTVFDILKNKRQIIQK